MNIDDIKLQLYVDGELDKNEATEVDKFIQVNPAAKKKVEEYRQINNLLFEKYKSIEQENIPQRTVDLLIKEKKSFFKKLFNYEIKLVNALAAACIVLTIFTVSNYNFDNKNLDNLNVQSKTSILNELSNIIGEENISSLTSTINRKRKRAFRNSAIVGFRRPPPMRLSRRRRPPRSASRGRRTERGCANVRPMTKPMHLHSRASPPPSV